MILVPALITLVVALALAGRLWAGLPVVTGRTAAWLALAAGVAAAAMLPWHPIARMVSLCCVLLAAMKAVVYVEWSGGGRRKLTGTAYLAFALLWFGMDPGAFARRKRGLEWRSHLGIGLLCMAAGTLAALVVRNAGWTLLLVVFVPMSIGFHFGALRVLTAGWRRFGFPVRTLFRNPLASRSLADFWGGRWNLGYSQMMARVVKRPLEPVFGAPGATLAVFLVSGVLHEVAITLPVGAGFGLPTLYFLLQGVAMKAERLSWIAPWRRLWAALVVVLPIGLLFPSTFHTEVILPCLRVLPDLTTLAAL